MSDTIVKMKFGADLYGTVIYNENGDRKSDIDIKGISFQSSKDFILNGPRKNVEYSSTGSNNTKNSSEDIDTEIFTIHEFIKHCLSGQTVALDMLHCPKDKLIESTYYWSFIQNNRSRFYSKNIQSYLGYCQQQCAKYGIKGSRLNDAKSVLDWLDFSIALFGNKARISQCDLTTFPTGEHISVTVFNEFDTMFEVCNRKFQSTVKLSYARDIVKKFHDNYGERAKLAANNDSIDFKAVSHAFRVGYQVKQLFTEGDIIFPLKESDFIKQVKLGELKYIDIAPILEDLIDEVKVLKDRSTFPEFPDRDFWNDWLYDVMRYRINSNV